MAQKRFVDYHVLCVHAILRTTLEDVLLGCAESMVLIVWELWVLLQRQDTAVTVGEGRLGGLTTRTRRVETFPGLRQIFIDGRGPTSRRLFARPGSEIQLVDTLCNSDPWH